MKLDTGQRPSNRKLMQQLRLGLDKSAVETAIAQGHITERQAAGLKKWFSAVDEIRANPLFFVADNSGHVVGEVTTADHGQTWEARRYGAGNVRLGPFTSPHAGARELLPADHSGRMFTTAG